MRFAGKLVMREQRRLDTICCYVIITRPNHTIAISLYEVCIVIVFEKT